MNNETAAGGASVSEAARTLVVRRGERRWYLDFKPGACTDPALSPDGRQVAFASRKNGTTRIWVADLPVIP